MKRIACIILTLLLLIPAAGCSSTETEGGGTTAPTITVGTTAATTAPASASGLPERDLGDATFNFFVMGEKRNINNYSVEIFAESESGEPINDAVYKRNMALEEKYNFKITEFASENTSMAADAQKLIQAGDDVYQVLMFNLIDASNLAQKKMLTDIGEIEYVNLDAPWWDGMMNRDFSILNKQFYAVGDINIMDNNATWATFFNKKIISDLGLDDPYKLVEDKNWTLDSYLKLAQSAAADLDGNGAMDPTDRWGTVGEAYNAFMLFIAAGERVSRKDEGDKPYLVPPASRATSVIEKVYAIMLDTARSTINAGDYSGKYGNVFTELIRGNFKNDLALFYIAGVLSYTLLRDMESEYGMIPMPAFDDKQENFVSSISINNSSAVCLPVSNSRLDDTGFVIEAMAFESVSTLTPAYYDIALERKYMRDEESRAMLDIILGARVFDLASLYNWGDVYGIFTSMVTAKNTDFASRYAAIKDAAEAAVAETIKNLSE